MAITAGKEHGCLEKLEEGLGEVASRLRKERSGPRESTYGSWYSRGAGRAIYRLLPSSIRERANAAQNDGPGPDFSRPVAQPIESHMLVLRFSESAAFDHVTPSACLQANPTYSTITPLVHLRRSQSNPILRPSQFTPPVSPLASLETSHGLPTSLAGATRAHPSIPISARHACRARYLAS